MIVAHEEVCAIEFGNSSSKTSPAISFFSHSGPAIFIFFPANFTFLLTLELRVTIHEIEYALRQQRWREFQKVWRRIEWQRKRKQRRRGKFFRKFERNSRGCSDASPKFFMGLFPPCPKSAPNPVIPSVASNLALIVVARSAPRKARFLATLGIRTDSLEC